MSTNPGEIRVVVKNRNGSIGYYVVVLDVVFVPKFMKTFCIVLGKFGIEEFEIDANAQNNKSYINTPVLLSSFSI